MKRPVILLLCLLLVFPALSLAEEARLNLFTWETYIDDEVIAAFELETGVKVTYSPAQTNDEMLLKMSESGGKGFDLILASDYILDIMRKTDLLQKLDQSKLPNIVNLGQRFVSQYYDPDDEFTVPYLAGTPLIVYDPAQVDIDITGYEDLWDPSLQDSVVIFDDARLVVGFTLKTLGRSLNETDPAILEQAKEKLMPLLPNIRAFDYDTPYLLMINGETSVGFMFTPQVYEAVLEKPDLKVVYPKEGLGFGIDGLALSVQAEHVNNAHLFLDYLMRPEVAAHNAMEQYSLNVNEAAEELLDEDFRNSPVIYIPGDLLVGAEFIKDIGPAETTMQEIYTAFKLQ